MATFDSSYFPGESFQSDELADLLEKGADYMDQAGFATWTFQNGDGHVCLRGALAAAQNGEAMSFWGNPMACAADNVMAKYLRKHDLYTRPRPYSSGIYPGDDCSANWNNEQTDKYVVVDAMKHAAKELRNGEIS